MKTLFTLIAITTTGLADLSSLSLAQATWADTGSVKASETTRSFAVENMTCATCPIAVKTAMLRVDGVQSVTVDFETKTAVAVFDPAKTSAQAIAAASTDVGYPAAPVED